MNHPPPRQYFAATQRALANTDGIGWNDLPPLAAALVRRLLTRRRGPRATARRGANDSHFQPTHFQPTSFGPAWDNTVVAAFDPEPPAARGEPLAGVAVCEMNEPDVFRHFFGAGLAER